VRPLSLKWRLSLLVTLVVAVVVGAVSATAYVRIRRTYLGHIDRMLTIMGNALATKVDPPRPSTDLEAEARHITRSPWKGTGTHFRIWTAGRPDDLAAGGAEAGKKAAFLWDLPAERRPSPGQAVFFDVQDKKKHYRLLWKCLSGDGGDTHIVIAHPSSYEHRRLDEVLATLLLAGGGLILATAVLGTWLVRLGIRPIRQVTDRLSRLGAEDLGEERLGDLAVPRELEPFAQAVERLLERLDAALEQQKQFASDAAHELRTPLSVARSTLELTASQPRVTDDTRAAVEEALGDLDRMDRLIAQLLTLARIDRTRGMPEPVAIRLDAMLHELAAEYHALAAGEGGAVTAGDLAPCVVQANEKMLGLVFRNLLDNALAYGPAGGTVRMDLAYGPGACCTATVRDEGGGLPPDALPHLFDRFYRVESSRNRGTGGSGLGLAIAREVVRRHGGDIWATSSPETQTTLHVRLPCTGEAGDGPEE